jgi:hypothetical protein
MNEKPRINVPPGWSVRAKIMQSVHSPLGFFVLALLIVEIFLLGAGIWFHLEDSWKIVALGTGVLLFLVVFFTVVYLVVVHPRNLVFSEESHVQFAAMKLYGTEENQVTRNDLDALPLVPQEHAISAGNQQSQLPNLSKD